MNTVKIKTSELSGKALDWAVGQCACENDVVLDVWPRSGLCVTELVPFSVLGEVDYTHKNYHPSTDWSQCGPLIDDYDIEFVNQGTGIIGAYAEFSFCPYEDSCGTGGTHLVAACRAIVAAELGDEVEIPEELVG